MYQDFCLPNNSLTKKAVNVFLRFLLPIILTVCIVVPNFNVTPADASVSVVQKYNSDVAGYVNVDIGNFLNVRSGPGSEYDVLTKLSKNTVVQITGETCSASKELWYEVGVAEKTYKVYGYVHSGYISFVSSDEDPAFENQLKKAGFPESYITYLRVLHKIYPEWTFEPLMTGLDWAEVVKNESVFRRNNIYMPSRSSWKSLVDGAFDWEANEWVGVTGAMWAEASQEILIYYLDPRNFMNDTQIFQMELLSYNKEVHTVDGVNEILKGTFMYNAEVPRGSEEPTEVPTQIPTSVPTQKPTAEPTKEPVSSNTEIPTEKPAEPSADVPSETESVTTEIPTEIPAATDVITTEVPTEEPVATQKPMTYAELFVEIGEMCDASPYMLAARVRQEQGVYGTSKLISGTVPGYEGYYNYFNIKASGTTDAEVLKNGLEEAKQNGWTSPYLAIKGGAETLVSGHISKGQDTLYLQKFDVDDTYYGLYWHQYMQNVQAPASESSSVCRTYKELNVINSAIAFKIPVYNDMPSVAAACPQEDGNPNYRLGSLNVEGFNITPSFDSGTFTYTLRVHTSVSEINISAKPYADTTVVVGCGTISLAEGENIIKINSVSERGDSAIYKVVVYRESTGAMPEASGAPIISATTIPDYIPAASDTPTESAPPIDSVATEKATVQPSVTESVVATSDPMDAPVPPAERPENPPAPPAPPGANTAEPTAEPTVAPTAVPTAVPTAKPTAVPTAVPTAKPTAVPTAQPSSYTMSYTIEEGKKTKGSVLTGVSEQMSFDAFLAEIKTENCNATVTDGSGSLISRGDEIIKTGDILTIKSGKKELLKCVIVLYGDVTCDGKINALDFVYIKRHVWGIAELTGASYEAADVGSRDGKINGIDFVYIKRHVWNISPISQE